MSSQKVPQKYQPWVDARKRFKLSHAQVQMARELGMNPKKLGGMANHAQEPWKAPLPQYIESLYRKQFNKDKPDQVRSIEQLVSDNKRKKTERKTAKQREDAEHGANERAGDFRG